MDQQDQVVFLRYLQEYLLPKNEQELSDQLSAPDITPAEKKRILKLLALNNFHDEITLLAYCLMPNHFHFFVHQRKPNSIDKFMNSLATRYSMYFNKKYDRVGSLYQDVYKAVRVETESHFLHLTRYIHQQALPYHPSSYKVYITQEQSSWVHPEEVLSYFSKHHSYLTYESFMKEDGNFLPDDIILEKD